MVADNGRVVLRAGENSTDPIRLYENFNLSSVTDIATVSANTFSVLGQSPGISDDGEIVVFYGDLTAGGATALNTTGGPGIFANIPVGGGMRRTLRVARRQVEDFSGSGNHDGVCDPGETCRDGELGTDSANNPLFLTSFNADSRIAVIHQSLGVTGIQDDSIVVSFLGTPNAASSAPQYFSNQPGLWTIQVDIRMDNGTLREKPVKPVPVVQINDVIGTRTIADIQLFDPIANASTDDFGMARTPVRGDHRVVFWASTSAGGKFIVRGSHLDSDEDGLLDH